MVPFLFSEEAHYFCGYVNSSLFRLAVKSYSAHGTGGFGFLHTLGNVKVLSYINEDQNCVELAKLYSRAHENALKGYSGDESAQAELRDSAKQIDRTARLLGLSEEELQNIYRSLKELKGE